MGNEKQEAASGRSLPRLVRFPELASIENVPCNGCTLCCKGDAVRLLPGDDISLYEVEPHPMMPGQLMLAHKPNGDCIYLGDRGCSIHSWRPKMCREMDCRRIALKFRTKKQARRMAKKGLNLDVWRRGRELLKANAEMRHGE